MGKLKICVYAISKNEAHFVPRFCESAKDADLILIADTGSTDGLPEVARSHGAVVHDICITKGDFNDSMREIRDICRQIFDKVDLLQREKVDK